MITPRFDVGAALPDLAELGRVHVLAIGGAGMSAVARLLLAAGVRVSGSDAVDSPVLAALTAAGAEVHVGHDPAFVRGADTVVISSAIRETNVELAAARAAGVRVLHRSQALACLMRGRVGVAVAGANGKTTTTSMLTVALIECGADPSYAIGGELSRQGTNAHLGAGDAFVVEADESDGSFVVYHPDVAIVTNVQPDHLDFYGTYEAVQSAYATFAGTISPGGLLITCADDAGARLLGERARRDGLRVVTYGTGDDADVQVLPQESEGLAGAAVLRRRGTEGTAGAAGEHELRIALPGAHNLLNAAAAFIAATDGLGHDPDAVLAGLSAFGGVRRRFEVMGEAAGIRVVDDYAHNPGKVAAVVSTALPLARGDGNGRLVALFQPHLYSRTRDFAAEFAAGLAPADVVLVMDVYGAREDPIDGVSGQLVVDQLARLGVTASHLTDRAGVAGQVAGILRAGDLLLTIGAGDVTQVGPAVLSLLRERAR